MARIRINTSETGIRKDVSSAQEEFLRHCRRKNLSPRTLEYYRENLTYIQRVLKPEHIDELNKDRVDDPVDQGQKEPTISISYPIIHTQYLHSRYFRRIMNTPYPWMGFIL